MSKTIESKKVQVQEIAEKFQSAASVVVVDYRGLTVAQVTELRKQLREAGVEFKVYKNTLTRRAAEIAGLEGINEFLTGPNAIAFSIEDMKTAVLNKMNSNKSETQAAGKNTKPKVIPFTKLTVHPRRYQDR